MATMIKTRLHLITSLSRRLLSSASPTSSINPARAFKHFQIGGVKSDGSTQRFYEKVNVLPIELEESKSYAIDIDNRLLQTPQKKILLLPTHALALAISGEWALQQDRIRPTSMPLTALATTAIDQFSDKEERKKCLSKLKMHLRSDAICFRVDSPPELVAKQVAQWDPLVEWVKKEFNAPLKTTTELEIEQPETSIDNLYKVIKSTDPWRLTAIDAVASIARSYVIGLAVERGQLTPEQAYEAARIDEEHQIDSWGRVEGGHDIDQAFTAQRMSAVGTFLQLLK